MSPIRGREPTILSNAANLHPLFRTPYNYTGVHFRDGVQMVRRRSQYRHGTSGAKGSAWKVQNLQNSAQPKIPPKDSGLRRLRQPTLNAAERGTSIFQHPQDKTRPSMHGSG